MGNVPDDVTRILGPGETVQLFIQQKIYHPKISVDSVVLTNERIILRHPPRSAVEKGLYRLLLHRCGERGSRQGRAPFNREMPAEIRRGPTELE